MESRLWKANKLDLTLHYEFFNVLDEVFEVLEKKIGI